MIEVKRGELYWVDWYPGRGSEQTGIRPALIIQNDLGNRISPTVIVASCSTAEIKHYPFMVTLKKEESDLPKDCIVNLASLMTISKMRLKTKCGQLTKEKMDEVDMAIKFSLGIDDRLRD